jgi:hypothetical protein
VKPVGVYLSETVAMIAHKQGYSEKSPKDLNDPIAPKQSGEAQAVRKTDFANLP